MEHEERIQDKEHSQERYRMEQQSKGKEIIFRKVIWVIVLALILFFCVRKSHDVKVNHLENELQATVDELGSDGVEKWDSIRTEIYRQIEEAERKFNERGTK